MSVCLYRRGVAMGWTPMAPWRSRRLTIHRELVTVGFPFDGTHHNEEGRANRGGTPLMPDEWVVLREDIARALLGEGLRIPIRPAPQKFVEIDLEQDSLADIEAKLEALHKRLEAQGLMASDSGTSV
jgi:hypothetical protein